MTTTHEVLFADASYMERFVDESVDLVVTSPPYPMIEMWDHFFTERQPRIKEEICRSRFNEAFELMHQELDPVWREIYRVLKPGRLACINIGDATRSLDDNFQLFPSHARMLNFCLRLGFQNLPNIIWRKPTNGPNRFMGSGMLPCSAYVTLEHEYILILRKGTKRQFVTDTEKRMRRESACFWYERNNWYSDVWLDLKGAAQDLDDQESRTRSAAFPFELAYRLINMHSVKGDLVLDPFLGTGTTMLAAMASERSSIGYEIDPVFQGVIDSEVGHLIPRANAYIRKRLQDHIVFVEDRLRVGKPLKYVNEHYGFRIISQQERRILIRDLLRVTQSESGLYSVEYDADPQRDFCNEWTSQGDGAPDATSGRSSEDRAMLQLSFPGFE